MKPNVQRPWTVERRVGYLVEIRVNHLDSLDEVRRFTNEIVKVAGPSGECVLVVDLRTPVIFAPDVADGVIALMTRANRVRKKTGILLADEHAVFGMQLARLVRKVGDPNRQTFYNPVQMLTWLADVVTPDEAKRAHGFIGVHRALDSAG
jgi:hypothetical protein